MQRLSSLREVRANSNRLTSLRGLPSGVVCVDVADNKVASLRDVATLRELREFAAANNAISDIAGLAACTKVRTLARA